MTSADIGQRLHGWFGAGQSIGWLVMAVVGIGIAHGMLRSDVAHNQAEINRMNDRMTYITNQIILVRETQSGSGVDIGNIKEDIRDIKVDMKGTKNGIDDVKELLIGSKSLGIQRQQ